MTTYDQINRLKVHIDNLLKKKSELESELQSQKSVSNELERQIVTLNTTVKDKMNQLRFGLESLIEQRRGVWKIIRI